MMRLSITLFLVLILTRLSGQSWMQKVGNSLQLELAKPGTYEVIVIMDGDQKITTSNDLTKEEKAYEVYTILAARADRSQAALSARLDELTIDYQSFVVVNALSLKAGNELIREIAQRDDVRKIIHDPWFKVDIPSGQKSSSSRMVDTTYGVKMIEADLVWAQGHTGAGVTIAGQDTGYEWDLAPLKSKYRGWNATDSTVSHDYHWHDAIHEISPLHEDSIISPDLNPCGLDSAVPCDDHNHGTHTMGTMVGSTEEDLIGIAPDAKWIGCRNLERGWGHLSTYVECFEFFLAPTDLNGENPEPSLAPHVINNSWYCPAEEGCTEETWGVMDIVMNNIRESGTVIVVSAGNSGPDCRTIQAPPAIFSSAFTVGAVRESGTIGNFSSRGPLSIDTTIIAPHVTAPGVDVKSVVRGGSYQEFTGTSMAGPHAAGLVALLISAEPSLAGNVDLIEEIIMNTAFQKGTNKECNGLDGSAIPNVTYGHGIIKANAALTALLSVAIDDPAGLAEIKVFPNPTTGHMTFASIQGVEILDVNIFDMAGHRILIRTTNAQQVNVNLSDIPSGLYLYKVTTRNGISSGKLNKI